jgi:hypothetical protein
MTDKELLEAILGRVRDGRLECKYALELAEELEISPVRIGRICDEENIRIINCQLGCFGTRAKNKQK